MSKILFISSNEYVPWGGSELLWSEAAAKLTGHGVRVTVSVKDWGTPVRQIERLRSFGCRIVGRRAPSLLTRLRRKILLAEDYPADHVRHVGADADLIVVAQGNNFDGLPWLEACNALGKECALIVQACGEQYWPTDTSAERLARGYEAARGAFFVSQANLELTRRQFASPLHHARVVRNPFNVKYDVRPSWPTNAAAELSLACVARLDALQKGQDLLLQVLDRPAWRSRHNLRVTLVGDGPNARGLRRLADGLKLTNIHFSGFVEDIEALWTKHHALILPSRFEGLPLSVVEAMLCGRACIATDVGGNRELICDGVNGFLAKAPTVDLLDEAMTRAWEDRGRLKEMGERAASDVRKMVSPDPAEDFAEELLQLLALHV